MLNYEKKKKSKRGTFFIILFSLIILFLQISVINFFSYETPDLIFIFVIFISIYAFRVYLPIIFLVLGLILDSVIGKYIGVEAMIFFWSSIYLGFVSQRVRHDNFIATFIALFLTLIFRELLNFVVYHGITFELIKISEFITHAISPVLINLLTIIVINFVLTYRKRRRFQ